MDCPKCGYKSEQGLKSCLQCGFALTGRVFRPDRFAPIMLRAVAFVVDAIFSGLLIWGVTLIAGDIKSVFVKYIIGYIIYVAYGSVFEISPFQATPGKLLVGIRVINVNGKSIGLKFGFLRNLTKIFSVLTIFGGIMAFINDGNQAVHDLFGRDYVIYRRDA
jgi:uncharacterized RDD family membrane protein YckC